MVSFVATAVRKLSPRTAFSLTLLISLCFSLAYVWSVASRLRAERRHRDLALSQEATTELITKFFAAEVTVEILGALVSRGAAIGDVSRSDLTYSWNLVSKAATALTVHELAMEVPGKDRTAFEANQLKGAKITEIGRKGRAFAGNRDRYVVIAAVNPLKDNERAVALDLLSEGARAEVIERASRGKNAVFSEPIALVQDGADEPDGLLVVQALGKLRALGYETSNAYSIGVIRFDDLITSINKRFNEARIVSLHDITDEPRVALWTDSKQRHAAGDVFSEHFRCGGRLYDVSLVRIEIDATRFDPNLIATALSVLLISFLLALLVRAFVLQRLLAEEHRKELQNLAAELMDETERMRTGKREPG